jgi:hypothetical protein
MGAAQASHLGYSPKKMYDRNGRTEMQTIAAKRKQIIVASSCLFAAALLLYAGQQPLASLLPSAEDAINVLTRLLFG